MASPAPRSPHFYQQDPGQPDSLNVSNTTDLSRFALLVTTFNSPEREALYTPRLQWWLYNSALDLFVVDSAGRCFPAIDALRFRCFAFNQSADPLLAALEANHSLCDPPCLGVPRSSVTERLAITKALAATRAHAATVYGARRPEAPPAGTPSGVASCVPVPT